MENADGLSRGPDAANGFAAEEGGRSVRVWEPPDPPNRGDFTCGLGLPRSRTDSL